MRRFCVRLPLIYIRGPYFRGIMTSLMSQGSRARTRRRVETGFGWLWWWRSISPPSRSASRDRSELEFEKVARSPRSSLLHLTFTMYAFTFNTPQSTTLTTPLQDRSRRAKTRGTPGYSWFQRKYSAEARALNRPVSDFRRDRRMYIGCVPDLFLLQILDVLEVDLSLLNISRRTSSTHWYLNSIGRHYNIVYSNCYKENWVLLHLFELYDFNISFLSFFSFHQRGKRDRRIEREGFRG